MSRPRGRPPHPDQLTLAEWRVADGVRHGLTNRAIAGLLGVSTAAVKFHVANAVGKLGLRDRAALRLWCGIPRDSALAGEGRTMTTEISLGSLGQIARAVRDVREAEAWFRDVLGLTHLYSFGPLAFFDLGGVRLFLREGGGEGASILYFRVPDIHAAQVALAARGVTFLGAPHVIHRHEDGTEEWMAFFEDPEGRPLALMSQVPSPG
jgi:DNA-binding CsgD family transcriptional regulator/catechol 2,3-dioxygenase-like lactoylglutathione lyase family enzyme